MSAAVDQTVRPRIIMMMTTMSRMSTSVPMPMYMWSPLRAHELGVR
jgi:hypothetical protein